MLLHCGTAGILGHRGWVPTLPAVQHAWASCHPPALPCCSFTTYVMLQALLAKPLSLLRLWGLVLYWLRWR